MIRNILKIAFRNLYHSKFFSLINILGLSIGLACSLLILIVVKQEMTYDRFHEKLDHLFVVQTKMDLGTGFYTSDRCGSKVGPALAESFPAVKSYVRQTEPVEMLLTVYPQHADSTAPADRKSFVENYVIGVDSNFLNLFTFDVLMGNAGKALQDPYSIVLTEESAKKYFGDADPVGQVIRADSEHDLTVTAVVNKPPVNSSIQFEFLVPFRYMIITERVYESYNGNPYFNYLYFDNPEAAAGMDTTVSDFLDQYQTGALTADQKLMPLRDMHRKGETRGQIMVLVMTSLAIVILVIACINFMNLSTARYLNRAREVGIRKVVGARKGHLVRQFLGETMIITFVAINLAVLILDFGIPEFNRVFGLEVRFDITDPVIITGLAGTFLVTSLLAGSYPAFFLSSFNAVTVLRKVIRKSRKGIGIRKVLVVIQFLFTTMFIIISVVNYRQVQLMNRSLKDIDSDNIIYFPVRGKLLDNYMLLRHELMQHPDIVSVTTSDFVPKFIDRGEIEWGLTDEATNDIAMVAPVGYDFAKTFGLEMVEGRFYSESITTDSVNAIVINQSAAEALNLEDPAGKTIYFFHEPYTIIGILEDFTVNPLKLAGNKAIFIFRQAAGLAFVRTGTGDPGTLRDFIEEVHNKFNPDYPFEFFYLEEHENYMTRMADNFTRIILMFTVLGIIISYLGLFGLSVFAAEQKTKEIGIRKAVGASSERILRLVVFDFLKLILISLLISIPLSILLIRGLLQVFAESIVPGPGPFLVTSAFVIITAVLTISYQSLKLSMTNPASSLRYE